MNSQKTTSTNKQTPGLGRKLIKLLSVLNKTFFQQTWLDHHVTISSKPYHHWFFSEPLVSCFYSLSIFHPSHNSWHQGFPKTLVWIQKMHL